MVPDVNLAIYLHGFGQRYDLPISLALYLYAAAGVVVVSFVMVALFAGERQGHEAIRHPRLPAPWLLPLGRSAVVRVVTGVVGVVSLAAVVVLGLAGSDQPTHNPGEILTWIYFWAGLVILSGLVGNLWTLFNPWTAIYDLLVFLRGRRTAPFRLPESPGVWPAAAVYLSFAMLELASGVASQPRVVASLALAYTAVTLTGMVLFGRDRWLGSCEGFTVLFSVVGRFGPVGTERDEDGRLLAVWLRPWGTGLLQRQRAGWDWVCFVILMLSSLAFDGILFTPAWNGFASALTPWAQPLGPLAVPVVKGFGLVLVSAVFLLIFVAFVRLMLFFGGGSGDPVATVTAFALTLVPIALVYNAAHNYGYLTVQSQYLFPLLTDPLGRSVATQLFQPSFLLAGASTVWYLQIVLIVTGHVIAVYLAHLRAGERFRSAQRALLSQYPMLVLMVLYTMTSLWILAQPITAGG